MIKIMNDSPTSCPILLLTLISGTFFETCVLPLFLTLFFFPSLSFFSVYYFSLLSSHHEWYYFPFLFFLIWWHNLISHVSLPYPFSLFIFHVLPPALTQGNGNSLSHLSLCDLSHGWLRASCVYFAAGLRRRGRRRRDPRAGGDVMRGKVVWGRK